MATRDRRPDPILLQDGRILVAQRANDDERLRMRMVRVSPDDEPYAAWLAQVQQRSCRDAVRVIKAYGAGRCSSCSSTCSCLPSLASSSLWRSTGRCERSAARRRLRAVAGWAPAGFPLCRGLSLPGAGRCRVRCVARQAHAPRQTSAERGACIYGLIALAMALDRATHCEPEAQLVGWV